jgi:hypothetical protein
MVIGPLLYACVTSARSQPHLTLSEVGRIADVRVGGVTRVSRDFDRVKLSYSSDKHVWFVDYREKTAGYLKYNIEIDDNTDKRQKRQTIIGNC